MKADVLEGRVLITPESAVKMAGYSLQGKNNKLFSEHMKEKEKKTRKVCISNVLNIYSNLAINNPVSNPFSVWSKTL